MTIKQIEEALIEIEELSHDNEDAHIMEDELYSSFIDYVSDLKRSDKDLAKKAKLILTSKDIDFERYYA